ncbi:unnamed protein product [Thelazia callipaeda]|uniref:Inhibitor of growth protein n=1 Tax=Thelazia callipaeda TaxID=103827 RepID=A0A158RAT5_THECL|nr:unnamed protein product [Thelazia callipaeda]
MHERANKQRDEFFSAGRSFPQDARVKHYKDITELYKQTKALSDEKVAILDICHSLLVKYSQKLNKEIVNFKLELEADNPGITEQIEKRKRKCKDVSANIASSMNGNSSQLSETSSSLRGQRGQLDRTNRDLGSDSTSQQQNANHSLGGAQEEESNNRIHNSGGERNSDFPQLKVIVKRSLVNSHKNGIVNNSHSSSTNQAQLVSVQSGSSQGQYSMHSSKNVSSASMNNAGTSGHAAHGSQMMSLAAQESRHGRPRKLTSRAQEMLYTMQRHERRARSHTSHSPEQAQGSDDESDSDRRVWCFCREKGYGSMIACDNPTCRYEWFHYGCVNVTEKPKGRWYCSECAPKQGSGDIVVANKA